MLYRPDPLGCVGVGGLRHRRHRPHQLRRGSAHGRGTGWRQEQGRLPLHPRLALPGEGPGRVVVRSHGRGERSGRARRGPRQRRKAGGTGRDPATRATTRRCGGAAGTSAGSRGGGSAHRATPTGPGGRASSSRSSATSTCCASSACCGASASRATARSGSCGCTTSAGACARACPRRRTADDAAAGRSAASADPACLSAASEVPVTHSTKELTNPA